MSKNELIKTNSLRYKIYNFFVKLFSKNTNEDNKQNQILPQIDKESFEQKISCREKIAKLNMKKELAKKLMSGELKIKELSDIQVDEMTEYFDSYINEMNQKLNKVKNDIIYFRNNN